MDFSVAGMINCMATTLNLPQSDSQKIYAKCKLSIWCWNRRAGPNAFAFGFACLSQFTQSSLAKQTAIQDDAGEYFNLLSHLLDPLTVYGIYVFRRLYKSKYNSIMDNRETPRANSNSVFNLKAG